MIRRLAPLIVFIALACVLLWPALSSGRTILPASMLSRMAPWNAPEPKSENTQWNVLAWDSMAQFYPWRTLLGHAIRSGEVPLWNPYQMCGIPFLANAQSAVLYPPNLLFAVFPPGFTFNLLAILHLIAAGSFTYIFLRVIGLSRIASTFGGIAFMLSGFTVTWLELPSFLSTGVWLPLALYFTNIAHERRSIYGAAGAGVAIALSLVGGHPQIAFYCVLAVALYWLYLGISSFRAAAIWSSFWLACLTFAVAFALAAPQLLPSFQLAAISHRGGALPTAGGYAAYSSLAMQPWRLITLFVPDFFGNPSRQECGFGYGFQYPEYCCYIGILPLLLLLLAFGGVYRRQAWFFAGIVMLAMLMALGTGVNRLFYFGIPGFANSGSPARVLFLFIFSIAILGAMGFDHVLKAANEKRPWTIAGSIFSAILVLTGGGIALYYALERMDGEFTINELFKMSLPMLQMAAIFSAVGLALIIFITTRKLSRVIGGVLVIGILAADLIAFGMGYNPTCTADEIYPATKLTNLLKEQTDFSRIMPLNSDWSLMDFPKAVLPPNSAMAYGLFDVQGYDSLYPMRYKRLLDAAGGQDSCPQENGNMVFARNPNSPVYDLLGVRWMISKDELSGKHKKIDGCRVYENTGALPRAYIVHTIGYADDEEALRRIVNGEADLRAMVLVSPRDVKRLDPGLEYPRVSVKTAGIDKVKIVKYTCNKVVMDVEAVGDLNILVFIDQYDSGWRAHIGKKLIPIVRADYAFRAIAVPHGKHTVVFSYFPRSFGTGLRLAKLGLLLLAGLVIFAGIRYYGERRSGSDWSQTGIET